MSVDNNGTVMSLASAPSSGALTGTGTLFFGIGTQTNNGLGSATVYTTTTSTSFNGPGLITATYKGQSLPESFLVMNGDVLTDLDYADVLRRHRDSGAPLTIATYARKVHIDFGVLTTDASTTRAITMMVAPMPSPISSVRRRRPNTP